MDSFAGSKYYHCIYYWRKYSPYGFGLDVRTHIRKVDILWMFVLYEVMIYFNN